MPNQILRAGRAFLVFGITAMLGVFVFIFILGSTGVSKPAQSPLTTPKPAVIDKISLKSGSEPANAPLTADEAAQDALAVTSGTNATQDLAKQLADEIIKRNPTGPGTAGAQKLNLIKPTDAVDKFIAEGLASFDADALHPRVPITDLRVIDDSTEAFQSYVRGNKTILNEKFASVHFENLNDLSKMDFVPALAAYKAAVSALLALPVPRSLAALHQKEIELVKGQQKMMSFLAHYNDDPLQAYLALNVGAELSREFTDLDKEMVSVLVKNQIAI